MKLTMLLAVAGGLVLTGCGNGVLPLPAEELQAAVTLSFSEQVGELPPEAGCAGDLGADQADTQTCTLDWRGDTYTITATRGAEGDASFAVEPPLPAYSAVAIEQNVANDYLTQRPGATITSVSCPEHMDGTVGEKQVCVVTLEDKSTVKATVSVSDIDGDITNFRVRYK